jgi:thioredoxin reductase
VTSRVTYLVIGAGPAGLQLGYFLDRAGLDYQILERADSAGSFFQTFPRHRRLISVNKVETGYTDPEKNLRWDHNSLLGEGPRFTASSTRYFPPADAMVSYLDDFATRHALRVQYETEVLAVTRSDEFMVETTRGAWTAQRVIIATGLAADNMPVFPGIEHAESYREMSTNPAEFRGQRVLIIGKGNSAFETADNLLESAAVLHLVSPRPLRLAWKTRFVGDLRAVNDNVLDGYGLKLQNTVLDADVEEIRRSGETLDVCLRYTRAQGQDVELTVDRVLRCTGFRFDASILEGCAPELGALDGGLPALTSSWESRNIPDLFFVGTLMQSRDYRRTSSAFIAGFRHNIQTLVHLLNERYHGVPRPRRPVELTVDALLEALMQRFNRSSSLFNQPDFLADLVHIGDECAEYFESLPLDLVREELGAEKVETAVVLTLIYGLHDRLADPFDIERFPDDGSKTHLLHPLVRIFRRGVVTAEHHVAEALDYEWSEPRHRDPLRRFLQAELALTE